MKKALLKILFLLAGSCIWTACSDDTPDQTPETTTISNEIYYANKLGKDILSTYYYWNKNITMTWKHGISKPMKTLLKL